MSGSSVVRRRWLIEGHVQGVFFRESTRREAEAIGALLGWVRNLPDGRVEVLAEGRTESLDRLAVFLAQGPPAAQVMSVVEAQAVPAGPLDAFRIRP